MKLTSNGTEHHLFDDDGKELKNIVSINLYPLKHGTPVMAMVTFINVQLELNIDPQFVEGRL